MFLAFFLSVVAILRYLGDDENQKTVKKLATSWN